MKKLTDTDLVTAAQAGDKAGFVDLVARYQGMVTGITLSILRDFQASEDAAQEAFITAWKKISEIQDREKLRPWLAQIARNSALMALRKKRALPPLEKFPGASEIPRPDELIVKKEEAEIVLSALDALPEKLRLPLILFYREDQSVRKVSEALSLTPDIVKKRLSEGRTLLRRRVTRLLDPVMRATGPGVLFTTAVASTIGAMMSPSAIAATAVSTIPKTATLTAVTTSKFSLAATVLTLGLCLPVGYGLHRTLESHSPTQTSLQAPAQASPSLRRNRTTSETSPLVAQWNALKARHLTNGPKGFPNLFQEINALEDPLQREAFILLGLADWAKLAPKSALTYFTNSDLYAKQSSYCKSRIISEWLRHDTPAALTAVEQHNLWSRGCSRSTLEFLSKGDPNHLTRAISLLPTNYNTDNARSSALGEAARRDLTATIRAIDIHLSSSHRPNALSAIARFLSETDPTKARTWISELALEDQTPDLTMSHLIGLAKYDPNIAFQELDKLKGSLSWHAEGAILKALSQSHFTKALSWANKNPAPDLPDRNNDPFKQRAHDSLKHQFTSHLEEQGPAFLEELKRDQLLDKLSESNLSSNDFATNHPKIFAETWSWLKAQESSQGVSALTNNLLTSALQLDPQHAFQLLKELESQPSYQNLSSNLAQNFLSLFPSNAPEILQPALVNAPQIIIKNIVSNPDLDLSNFENFTFWHEQLQQLPLEVKPSLASKLAAAMTQRSPSKAAEWIAALPDRESQQTALQSSYHEWVQSYPEDAEHSLETLSGHPNFDTAAAGLLSGLARFDPDLAYSRLQELGPTWRNYETTADQILLPLAKHEPDLASKWLTALTLTDEHRENLTRKIEKIEEQSKLPTDPFSE
jgi:RNA polymerase sigma factor (sigma-70 family)